MSKGLVIVIQLLALGLYFHAAEGQPKTNDGSQYFLYEYDSLQRIKSISPCHYFIDTIHGESSSLSKYLGPRTSSGFRPNHAGLYRAFDTLGHLSVKGYYHNSTKVGDWYTFSSGGQLLSHIYYVYSDESISTAHGWAWVWYPNGKDKCKGKFENGKRIGRWTWYHENGKIALQVNFKEGLPEGDYTAYYYNGNIAMTGNHEIVYPPKKELPPPPPRDTSGSFRPRDGAYEMEVYCIARRLANGASIYQLKVMKHNSKTA